MPPVTMHAHCTRLKGRLECPCSEMCTPNGTRDHARSLHQVERAPRVPLQWDVHSQWHPWPCTLTAPGSKGASSANAVRYAQLMALVTMHTHCTSSKGASLQWEVHSHMQCKCKNSSTSGIISYMHNSVKTVNTKIYSCTFWMKLTKRIQ